MEERGKEGSNVGHKQVRCYSEKKKFFQLFPTYEYEQEIVY
jgi:hypothetical protein